MDKKLKDKRNTKSPTIIAIALIASAIMVVCIFFCCFYVQRTLMRESKGSAVNSALLIKNNFSITDAEVAHMKTLDFNGMEIDPINQRLAEVATGVKFWEPIISIYVVAPLEEDEIKYVLDESNCEFWGVEEGTPLNAIWLLNMAVDDGKAIFAEREDIYRYTVISEELAYGFQNKKAFGIHTSDEWGDVITGYVPIYTAEGNFAGMLGVDFDIQDFQKTFTQAMITLVSILAVSLGCLIILFISLYMRYVQVKNAEIQSKARNAEILQKQQSLLKDILDNIAVGVYVIQFHEEGFKFILANSTIIELLGRDIDKLYKADQEDVFEKAHPDDIGIIKEVVKKLRCPGGFANFEYRAKSNKTGDYIWLSARGRSVGQPDGTVIAYICYADITEQKRLQDIQEVLEAEKAAGVAKSNFMSMMSHDMRTPLNAIINIATLAHDNLNDPVKLISDLDKIELSGAFLLGLINDVLDVNIIQSGKLKLQPSVYHYNDFTNYIDGIIVPLCRDKDIKFVWETGNPTVDIWVDKTRLNQVFFNLLSNAVKYTNAGGTVGFHMCNAIIKDNYLYGDFVVSDTGIGMSEEFQKKMFEPFEREDSVSAYAGTGLGLTITKQIVDLMGGTILVDSKPGKGTKITVRLSLPVATPQQIAAVSKGRYQYSINESNHEENRRILVVEDHPLNREIIIRLLEKEKYIADWVGNGKDALDTIAKCEPWFYQVILMDIRMPVMDGLSATKAIRNLDNDYARSVPIVAMTANAYNEDIQESLAAGMNEHLSKPIEPDKLYKILAMFTQKNPH